jgi:hypothetical protein
MIRERFPQSEVRFIDTVCQPTKQRQNAAIELAQKSDVVIVIGGAHSNNTHELVKTCSRFCARVHHVQTADDLRAEWFHRDETVGITAGTSTPDNQLSIPLLSGLLDRAGRPVLSAAQTAVAAARNGDAAVPGNPCGFRNDRAPVRAAHQSVLSKSPHGSFGKHVLTPTLALTSIAGATPSHWRVRYWDENLLQGPPPIDPLPEVVGITVHLTFAKRAYELADWYRARGSKVVLGGMHMQSCPEEGRFHADAIAVGDGVQLWPEILRDVERGELKSHYEATYERPYDLDPPPRREAAAAREFFDHHEPHRHARLPQSLRLLLSGHRRFAHAVSGP